MPKYNEGTDHLGQKFKSEKEMYEYWNIPDKTARKRKKSGWSVEKILTTPVSEKSTDHLGNIFDTDKDMYKYWNIPYNIGADRKRKKWTLEEILTTPLEKIYPDPLGNVFKSEKDMYEYWNISSHTGCNRKKLGWSLIQILNISPRISNRAITVNQTKYDLTISKRIKAGRDIFECYIDNGDGTSTFKIMSYDMIDQYCLEQYKKLHNTIIDNL